MTPIPFLIDENVPQSVADFLAERGHSVEYVRIKFPRRSPDGLIAVVADDKGWIVVTWDRDFTKLGAKARRMGRITFRCEEKDGRALLEDYIDLVELHCTKRSAAQRKVMITIQTSGVKLG